MSFTEEQIAFRDNVRKMVLRHVAPIAAEIDETDRFPLEIVKLFGEMGLMQLWVPEQYGGPNGNLTMACIAREEISKVSPACASIRVTRSFSTSTERWPSSGLIPMPSHCRPAPRRR